MQAPDSPTENLPVPFESMARSVLAIVTEGKTVPAALRELGEPMSLSYFLRRLKKNPDLAREYDEARQSQAMSMADQVIDIADSERDSARARNMIDARKWLASKLDPRVFGDRIDLNIEQSVSIKSALEAAESRILRPMCDLANQRQPQVIDLEAEIIDGHSDNESARPERRDAGLNSLDDLLA